MKRYLSGILALLMVLAVFTGCTERTKEEKEPVYVAETASSSSGYGDKFAGKMKEYLGINTEVTDKTGKASYIVGNGSDAEELGVNFDGMEDGYIIRKIDDTVLILGGNDAAADYAIEYFFDEVIRADGSFVDEDINIADKSYHRINRLTVAGRDISEFMVVLHDEADDCAVYASEELVKYIERACGVKLNVVKKNKAGGVSHAIELSIDPDGKLGDEGFTINTNENGIHIIGGIKRGCMYGVYELLEKYIGYRFLVRDMIYLYEAEVKDIPAGINDTQIPVFEGRDMTTAYLTGKYGLVGAYTSLVDAENTGVPRRINRYNDKRYGYAAPSPGAGHSYWRFISEGDSSQAHDPNPCLTDEGNINKAVRNVLNYIQEQLDAGRRIGVDFNEISFGQNDTDEWCRCRNCRDYIKETGSKSGPVVNITNIVARAVNERYPGIKVHMMAYVSALKAPDPDVIRCEDNVVVVFASLASCSNHLYSGEDCKPDKNPLYNGYFGGEINKWSKVAKDIRVWYYAVNFSYGLAPLPVIYNLREDMQYCADNNVTGVFTECEHTVFGFDELTAYLLTKLYWNPYITAQEYEDILTEFLMLYYGDGYVNILRYIHMWEEAGNIMGCFNCISGNNTRSTTVLSCEYYADNYSLIKELFSAAEKEANYKEKKLLDVLFVHVDYLSLCCEYDRMEKGQTDRHGEVMEKYRRLYSYLKDNYELDLSILEGTFILPKEPEYDKNPCKSWYLHDYKSNTQKMVNKSQRGVN